MSGDGEQFRFLSRYAERLPAGCLLYDQGQIPERLYVVLRGSVQFEVLGTGGEVEIAGFAGPGELAGHVAAMTGRPTSAAARCAEETLVLAVPTASVAEAFREAPGLAVQVVEALVAADRSGMPGARAAIAEVTGRAHAGVPPAIETIPIRDEVDQSFFFVDSRACPVCTATFEFVRVRTSAIRPASRDSDMYVRYTSADPTWYSLVCCPSCAYTAYHDDFAQLGEDERTRLWAASAERRTICPEPITGHRTADQARMAVDLALRCYGDRAPDPRRRAVLLHRRAWIERQRGDAEAECRWLTCARDAYRAAFEGRTDASDEAMVRMAYLVGDLSLRLGEPQEGARWLEVATRAGDAKELSGLIRMARERLHDAREAYAAQQAAQQAERKAS